MFADRRDAGRRLARELASLRAEDVVVFGLPRGGVPVAAEVARALDAPLDVIVVRKLGAPARPELAMGAVGEGGVQVVDTELVAALGVTDDELRRIEAYERELLRQRVTLLRHDRAPESVLGRTALVVDDGMATGATARVACLVAHRLGAAHVVLAVPVAPPRTVHDVTEADAVVCVAVPDDFLSVGMFYRDFSPVTEDEVVALLDAAAERVGRRP